MAEALELPSEGGLLIVRVDGDSPAEKAEMAVSEEMLRLSAGIEDVDDIVADLAAALELV